MESTIERDLRELKKTSIKLKKRVEDTEKGLKKVLKKVNGKGNSKPLEVDNEDMPRPRTRGA